MKTQQILNLVPLVALATAMPTGRLHAREVPQEHSHEQFLTTVRTFLNMNNPAGIVDPVFGLLGDKAAAGGLGSITDVECLQQATADQAFTNAKAAGSIDGMVGALVYRSLERNTQGIGTKSNPCTSIKAVNPQIAALSQHQDPASTGAAAANKAVALELAVQIASVGGDPTIAIKSGTFAPGLLTDNTGKGNTCDDANDPVGCIFTQNLLVPDVTADEIAAAVGSGSAGTGTGTGASTTTTTAAAAPPASSTTAAAAPASSTTAAAAEEAPTECAAPPPAETSAAAAAPAASSTLAAPPATTSATATPTSTSDFGTCANANPDIVFGLGFDGRTDPSFEPADLKTFNHGSALGIGVITSFICQQLNDKCKASATVLAACASGSAAAAKASGQAAADAFNAAF